MTVQGEKLGWAGFSCPSMPAYLAQVSTKKSQHEVKLNSSAVPVITSLAAGGLLGPAVSARRAPGSSRSLKFIAGIHRSITCAFFLASGRVSQHPGPARASSSLGPRGQHGRGAAGHGRLWVLPWVADPRGRRRGEAAVQLQARTCWLHFSASASYDVHMTAFAGDDRKGCRSSPTSEPQNLHELDCT